MAMMDNLSSRRLRGMALLLAAFITAGAIGAAEPSWEDIEKTARGQAVYWNGWGGDEKINAYIAWVGDQVKDRYGIVLHHVKVADIAETVSRILAEKYAGRHEKGTVDLLWINGENFHTMKDNGLLFGPFSERLPNYPSVDTVTIPSTKLDFTEPVDGMEAPWGKACLLYTSRCV